MKDNLAENYYSTAPYTYALNNPIKNIDPDGNFVITGTIALAAVTATAVTSIAAYAGYTAYKNDIPAKITATANHYYNKIRGTNESPSRDMSKFKTSRGNKTDPPLKSGKPDGPDFKDVSDALKVVFTFTTGVTVKYLFDKKNEEVKEAYPNNNEDREKQDDSDNQYDENKADEQDNAEQSNNSFEPIQPAIDNTSTRGMSPSEKEYHEMWESLKEW